MDPKGEGYCEGGDVQGSNPGKGDVVEKITAHFDRLRGDGARRSRMYSADATDDLLEAEYSKNVSKYS